MDESVNGERCEIAEDRAEWDDTTVVRVEVLCEKHGLVTDYDTMIDGKIVCSYCASDEEINSALRN